MTKEQALNNLKEALEHSNIHMRDTLLESFYLLHPELAESEDERIRKGLIQHLKELQDWIVYLKKHKENPEKEYVFRPLAGTDITIAAEQAIRRAMEGDHLVLAFNGWYIPVDKYATTEGLVDSYDTFIEKQKEQKPNIELIQRSWYMEGYHDREFGKEPKWILKTGEGGPKHELNPRYGQSLAEQQPTEQQMHDLNEAIKGLRMDGCERIADSLHSLYIFLKSAYHQPMQEQKPVEPSNKELIKHQKELYNFKVFAAKQAKEHHISFVHDFEWNNFCAEIMSYFNQPVEWSEEDEDIMYSIRSFLIQAEQSGKYDSIQIARIERGLNWLKSLHSNLKKKNEDVAKLCSNEWSEEDEEMLKKMMTMAEFHNDKEEIWNWLCNKVQRLKSLRPPQDRYKDCPHRSDMFLLTQGFKSGKHELAIRFMNYLDENSPKEKMSLSNGECEDIDKAFKENDWAKIMRYYEKYSPSWKPSEEQMEHLQRAINCYESDWGENKVLRSVINELKKL